jgi:non-homologous end joining protein Ku
MAPPASWKGYLKLSLVSCPIALYPVASTSERGFLRDPREDKGKRFIATTFLALACARQCVIQSICGGYLWRPD